LNKFPENTYTYTHRANVVRSQFVLTFLHGGSLMEARDTPR